MTKRERTPERSQRKKTINHPSWWIIPTLVVCIMSLVSTCDESHAPSKESATCQALFRVYAKASTWYSYCVQNRVVVVCIAVPLLIILSAVINHRYRKKINLLVTDPGIDKDDFYAFLKFIIWAISHPPNEEFHVVISSGGMEPAKRLKLLNQFLVGKSKKPLVKGTNIGYNFFVHFDDDTLQLPSKISCFINNGIMSAALIKQVSDGFCNVGIFPYWIESVMYPSLGTYSYLVGSNLDGSARGVNQNDPFSSGTDKGANWNNNILPLLSKHNLLRSGNFTVVPPYISRKIRFNTAKTRESGKESLDWKITARSALMFASSRVLFPGKYPVVYNLNEANSQIVIYWTGELMKMEIKVEYSPEILKASTRKQVEFYTKAIELGYTKDEVDKLMIHVKVCMDFTHWLWYQCGNSGTPYAPNKFGFPPGLKFKKNPGGAFINDTAADEMANILVSILFSDLPAYDLISVALAANRYKGTLGIKDIPWLSEFVFSDCL